MSRKQYLMWSFCLMFFVVFTSMCPPTDLTLQIICRLFEIYAAINILTYIVKEMKRNLFEVLFYQSICMTLVGLIAASHLMILLNHLGPQDFTKPYAGIQMWRVLYHIKGISALEMAFSVFFNLFFVSFAVNALLILPTCWIIREGMVRVSVVHRVNRNNRLPRNQNMVPTANIIDV